MPRLTGYLNRYLGGANLEVFKFGMYILFPIGWMYYFGTNLDSRFSVPDFWPKSDETHRIPTEREDIGKELARLKERRLRLRDDRLKREAEIGTIGEGDGLGDGVLGGVGGERR